MARRRWSDPWLDRISAGAIGPVPTGAHAHAHVELNLLTAGRMVVARGEQRRDLPPGRLLAFAATRPHAVVAQSADARLLWLTMPIAWVLAWPGFAARARSLLEGAIAIAPADEDDGLAMRRWLTLARRGQGDDETVVRLEVEARLRRLLPPGAPGVRGAASCAPAVQRMLEHLATHFTGPCQLADVARASGLCRSAAVRAFRDATGVGIHRYLVQLRLAQALHLRADGVPATTAAFAGGFGSLGRFYAACARRE